MVRYRFFSPFQGLFSQDAFKPIQIMPEFSWRIQALTRLIFNHHLFDLPASLLWNCRRSNDKNELLHYTYSGLGYNVLYNVLDQVRKKESWRNLLLVRD